MTVQRWQGRVRDWTVVLLPPPKLLWRLDGMVGYLHSLLGGVSSGGRCGGGRLGVRYDMWSPFPDCEYDYWKITILVLRGLFFLVI